MTRGWHTWKQAAPLWVTGLALIALGVALLWSAGRVVTRGHR